MCNSRTARPYNNARTGFAPPHCFIGGPNAFTNAKDPDEGSITDSSGQANVDPNGTNLTHTVTLDIGDAMTGQEYTITYTA